jgi:hypothetical protein
MLLGDDDDVEEKKDSEKRKEIIDYNFFAFYVDAWLVGCACNQEDVNVTTSIKIIKHPEHLG